MSVPRSTAAAQVAAGSRRGRPSGRRLSAVGVVTGLALVLTGCGSHVGSAALVGSADITSDTIDAQRSLIDTSVTDTLVVPAGEIATRIVTDRTLLTNEIWHQLVTQLALPVPLTEEQLNSYVAADEANPQLEAMLVATSDTLYDRISDSAALQKLLADTAQAGTPVSSPTVTFDYLQVVDLDTALADRNRYLADPAAMTADLAAAAAAQTGGNFTASAVTNGVSLISSGLFTASPGQIVVVADASSATLARIVSRTTESTPIDQTALSQASLAELNAVGAIVLGQITEAVPAVQVNPRFGVWDPELLQVVAGPGQV